MIPDNKYQYGRINYVIFLLLSGSILFPTLKLGHIGLRLSDFIALIFVPLFFILVNRIKLTKITIHLLFLWVFLLLSTFWGYIFLSVPPSFRDLNELIRMVIPIITYWLFLKINYMDLRKTVIVFFDFSTPCIIIFSFMQILIPKTLPLWLLSAYGGESHVKMIISGYSKRIIATGSDPNIGGMILLLLLFYQLSSYFFKRKYKNIFYFLLLFFLISVAASRTIMIALIFVFFVFLIKSKNIKNIYKVLLLIIGIVLFSFVWISSNYIRIGLISLAKGENNSWLSRIEKFKIVFELFKQSPIFGWGPAKSIHPTIVDGEYFLFLRRYGLVGILLLISLLLKGQMFFLNLQKRDSLLMNDQVIMFTYAGFNLSIFIIMITNNFFSGYQLVIPYFVLLGYLENLKYQKDHLIKEHI